MRTFFNGTWAWLSCKRRNWKPRTVSKTKLFTVQTDLRITLLVSQSRSVQLAPFSELFKPQAGQRVHVGSTSLFMSSRRAIVFVNELRQPFGYGEAFVFPVGNWLEEPWPDVLPVVLGNPASLRSKEALKNHCAVTGVQHLIQTNIPTCGGV